MNTSLSDSAPNYWGVKELLKLLLANINIINVGNGGLCTLVSHLRYKKEITNYQGNLLIIYLSKHKPGHYFMDTGYWWRPGKVEPRREWLENELRFY